MQSHHPLRRRAPLQEGHAATKIDLVSSYVPILSRATGLHPHPHIRASRWISVRLCAFSKNQPRHWCVVIHVRDRDIKPLDDVVVAFLLGDILGGLAGLVYGVLVGARLQQHSHDLVVPLERRLM
jgi:hypothetical protein